MMSTWFESESSARLFLAPIISRNFLQSMKLKISWRELWVASVKVVIDSRKPWESASCKLGVGSWRPLDFFWGLKRLRQVQGSSKQLRRQVFVGISPIEWHPLPIPSAVLQTPFSQPPFHSPFCSMCWVWILTELNWSGCSNGFS